MDLEIVERQCGDVVILDISGHLRLGAGTNLLRKTIFRLVCEGQKKIIFSFLENMRIHFSGVCEFLLAEKLFRQNTIEAVFLLQGRVDVACAELLMMARIFEIFSNEGDALKYLP